MASSTVTKRKSGGLVDNIKTIIYAGLIAVAVRTFAFEPFNIPSGSMIPTLLVGDYIFVSKFSYGYSRFSFPFSPPLFQGRILGSVPHYGDVVVFKLPRDTSVDYIKRIVGLPGDRVQVQHGMLYINGEEIPRAPAPDSTCVASDEGPPVVGRRYIETLPGGKKHEICKLYDQGGLNDTDVYIVPPGSVFAMGDNRDNSQDSRVLSAVGYIPIENVVGRAEIIWFSIDATAPWWEIWEWPFEIRWSRLLTGIT
jgi:signal peptidase I